MTDDGRHRVGSFVCVVTPLQPPFEGDVMFFELGGGQTLAVSKEDGERIKDMMQGKPKGRSIVLTVDTDPKRMRVYVSQ